MQSRRGTGFVRLAAVLAIAVFMNAGTMANAAAQDHPPASATAAKNAVAPAAPVLPSDLIDAMQEGRFDDAGRLLSALATKTQSTDEKAYFSYLAGIAQRLAGHRDAARETLRKAIEIDPNGRWTIKIRFELAGVELASGNWAAAEELARAEAERLLAGDRKDRLAGIYQDICPAAARAR